MRATLFGVPASHPSRAVELMLEHKRLPYRRIDLAPGVHRALLRALGFRGVTVPAMRLGRRRVQGTRAIALALDEVSPEPPLFPADPERRRAVEEAERFGDEVLQPIPRRLSWWALRRDRSPLHGFMEGARLGLPLGVAVRTAGPLIALSARLNRATDENVAADLAALPAALDRVDALIAEGTIGGDRPNAADFQIATSISLLMAFDDIRPALEGRPAADLARRIVPRQPGRVPPVVPPERLRELRPAA